MLFVGAERRKGTFLKYDFIEIGTCDYDALIQSATDQTVGISVEPVRLYLDRLPSPPLVKKLNVAIGDHSGAAEVHYIPPEVLERLQWGGERRGCNSVDRPHAGVVQWLRERGLDYDTIVRRDTVRMMTVAELFAEHDVTEIGVFKVDAEGMDPVIMQAYANCCTGGRRLASKVVFECNRVLSTQAANTAARERLQSIGYRIAREHIVRKQRSNITMVAEGLSTLAYDRLCDIARIIGGNKFDRRKFDGNLTEGT